MVATPRDRRIAALVQSGFNHDEAADIDDAAQQAAQEAWRAVQIRLHTLPAPLRSVATAAAIGTILANATEFRHQLVTGAAVTLQEGSLQ